MIVIGTFIRGPGWMWFWPGQTWDAERVDYAVNRNLDEVFGINGSWLAHLLPASMAPNAAIWARVIFGIFPLANFRRPGGFARPQDLHDDRLQPQDVPAHEPGSANHHVHVPGPDDFAARENSAAPGLHHQIRLGDSWFSSLRRRRCSCRVRAWGATGVRAACAPLLFCR